MKNTKFVVKVIRGSGTQYVERVDLIHPNDTQS